MTSGVARLSGKKVLFTRSGPRAGDLAAKVAAHGGEPYELPVTEVEPAGDPGAIAEACARLAAGELDWLVFASANAVEYFVRDARDYLGDLEPVRSARLAAVGRRTAAVLAEYGLRTDVVPEHGDAEALAAAVAAAAGSASRVLVPRAQEGRSELITALQAHVAEVVPLTVYRTVETGAADARIAAGLAALRAGSIDVVLLFAPSQVHALLGLLAPHGAQLLARVPIVGCIGKTTARALEIAGIDDLVVADVPDADCLLEQVALVVSKEEG